MRHRRRLASSEFTHLQAQGTPHKKHERLSTFLAASAGAEGSAGEAATAVAPGATSAPALALDAASFAASPFACTQPPSQHWNLKPPRYSLVPACLDTSLVWGDHGDSMFWFVTCPLMLQWAMTDAFVAWMWLSGSKAYSR